MTTTTELIPVDTAEQIINNSGYTWQIYRGNGNREWFARIEHDLAHHTIRATTITELCDRAARWVQLPAVPQRPTPHTYTVQRDKHDGPRAWNILCDGKHRACRKTRSEAEVDARAEQAANDRQCAEWHDCWATFIAGKTEDVDYRWEL